ncbi:Transcription initiation factor IIF subunit beta [Linum perenne]
MEKERPHTYRYNRYKREHAETEDDRSGNSVTLGGVLETAKADRAVWLMKCPVAVARSWQTQASSSDSQPVAKVVVSLDPLQADESPQVIDDNRGMNMRPMPGMVGLISSNPKEKKKPQPVKQTEVKRTRRDRGELEDIMFKLFERQPNWALKQLVQETDQPAQFLKEILNELCVYNKRGSNQGTYELKPEYKKTAVPEAGAEQE